MAGNAIRVTTAWASERDGERPWLISAYDETTFEEWGREPDFFVQAVDSARASGFEVRSVVLTTDYDAIEARFAAGEQPAGVAGAG